MSALILGVCIITGYTLHSMLVRPILNAFNIV